MTIDIVNTSSISTELKISESEVFCLARRLGYLPYYRIDNVEYFARETVDLMKTKLAEKENDRIEKDRRDAIRQGRPAY